MKENEIRIMSSPTQHFMDNAPRKTRMLVLWKDKFTVWFSSKLYSR